MCGGCDNCVMSNKQIKESTPYQIHLSVDSNDEMSGLLPEEFTNICSKLGIEGLVVSNIMKDKTSILDMFTNVVIYGTLDEAFMKIALLKASLKNYGIKVIREKIETHPYNPIITGTGYYERHYKLIDSDYDTVVRVMRYFWSSNNVGLSENLNTKKVMLTIRSRSESLTHFDNKCNTLINGYTNNSWIKKIVKDNPITEYAIYDSKIDNEWISI